MKRWGIIVTLLLVSALMAITSACSPGGESESEQVVDVTRGDLTLTVSGSGNLQVADEVMLAFGVAGKIDKINVEEGDKVSQGDVLAGLETEALTLAVTQAEVAVTQAEVAITQAEVNVTQAEVNLENAKIAVEQTQDLYTWSDIRIVQADVDTAEDYLADSLEKLYRYLPRNEEGDYPDFLEFILGEDYPKGPGFEALQERIVHAQARLDAAENRLEAMLSGFDIDVVAVKKQQVVAAEQSLELAQQSLALAQQSPKVAEQSLALARKQLGKATIAAPFAGVVAEVYVDEGDTVTTVNTLIHLIDTSTMELEVEVDEIDIPEVKPGQRVIIEVDALLNRPLEGKVISISQLPQEQAGVILFDVKIEFEVTEGIGLRIGMSASVDIVTAERSSVLLVPDRAIRQDDQGNDTVEVMVNEQTEERIVVTGLSDNYQTEIISGLTEGETVVEKRAK